MERLLEQGHRFGSLSVEQLATEAGMSRGTFYSHFRDKNELVARLMGLVTHDVVDSAGTWLAVSPDGEPPLREDLVKTMRGVSQTFRRHRAILAAFNDSVDQDGTLAAQFQQMMDTICDRCRRAIAAVQRSDASRSSTDDDVADALSWFVVLYLGRFSALREGDDLERLIRAVSRVAENSIFADGKP